MNYFMLGEENILSYLTEFSEIEGLFLSDYAGKNSQNQ